MSCLHIIINALILIFVVHFFITNIQFNQILGTPKNTTERFNNYHKGNTDIDRQIENKNINISNSLAFLQDDNPITNKSEDKDDDFRRRISSFIRGKDEKKKEQTVDDKFIRFEEKNVLPIVPSNSFTSNENVPNFESNVLNVQKFYTRNNNTDDIGMGMSMDNLGPDELKRASERFTTIKETPIPELSNDTNDNRDKFGRISTKNPPTWQYKNELPMNGGSMGGIVGFNSLESQFGMYNGGQFNIQDADSSNFQTIPHDDLRKPIVYEN